METFLAICGGAVCGIAAAVPLILQLRRTTADLRRGFVAVMFAFALIQAAMLVVRMLLPGLTAAFGVPATLVFLVMTFVAVLLCQG